MGETEWLTERFEEHRPRLQAVAYRILGSLSEAEDGDFEALVALLDPDVIVRVDRRAAVTVIRGAEAVAQQARAGANPAAALHPVLVNGAAGVVITVRGRPNAVMAFTVAGGKIVEIDSIADPVRVASIAAGHY